MPTDLDKYDAVMTETVAKLPPAFRTYVRNSAYQRGHSAGYDEVISIARGMVYELAVAIEQYEKDLEAAISGKPTC